MKYRCRRQRGGFILTALLLTVSVAAEAAEERPPLTWPDLVRLVDRHPAVLAAGADVATALAGVDEAGQVANPTLSVELGQGLARETDDQRFEWSVGVGLALDDVIRRGPRRDRALAELDQARESVASRRLVVLDRLRGLFWELVHAETEVEDLEADAGQLTELASAVSLRVSHGEARPTEALRIEVEQARLGAELDAARVGRDAARERLARWLGLAPEGGLRVAAVLEELPELPDRAELRRRVLAAHPELRALRAETAVAAAEVRVERRERAPGLELEPFYADELDRRAWGVQLAVELPLWNWNDEGVARAEAEQAARRAATDAAERELDVALTVAIGRCERGRAYLQRFRTDIVPRVVETARREEESYRIGDSGLLDALDARRTVLAVHREYRQALLGVQLACSRIALLASRTGETP